MSDIVSMSAAKLTTKTLAAITKQITEILKALEENRAAKIEYMNQLAFLEYVRDGKNQVASININDITVQNEFENYLKTHRLANGDAPRYIGNNEKDSKNKIYLFPDTPEMREFILDAKHEALILAGHCLQEIEKDKYVELMKISDPKKNVLEFTDLTKDECDAIQNKINRGMDGVMVGKSREIIHDEDNNPILDENGQTQYRYSLIMDADRALPDGDTRTSELGLVTAQAMISLYGPGQEEKRKMLEFDRTFKAKTIQETKDLFSTEKMYITGQRDKDILLEFSSDGFVAYKVKPDYKTNKLNMSIIESYGKDSRFYNDMAKKFIDGTRDIVVTRDKEKMQKHLMVQYPFLRTERPEFKDPKVRAAHDRGQMLVNITDKIIKDKLVKDHFLERIPGSEIERVIFSVKKKDGREIDITAKEAQYTMNSNLKSYDDNGINGMNENKYEQAYADAFVTLMESYEKKESCPEGFDAKGYQDAMDYINITELDVSDYKEAIKKFKEKEKLSKIRKVETIKVSKNKEKIVETEKELT